MINSTFFTAKITKDHIAKITEEKKIQIKIWIQNYSISISPTSRISGSKLNGDLLHDMT